jgi:hypothetical protein
MTWTHPKLGEFVADGNGWSTKLRIPEFDAFSYDTGYRSARRAGDPYPFSIRWFRGKRPSVPPPEMVAMAEDVTARPSELVAMIAHALWEDFNGRGALGGIDDVNKLMKYNERPPLNGAGEIPAALVLSGITVWNEVDDHARPVAHLAFRAAFETEHDVNILTDGRAILGASVGDDLRPYLQPGEAKKEVHNPFR